MSHTFIPTNIEQATYDSVTFRFVSANTHPDRDTITPFRKRYLEQFKSLFLQILLLADEMGLVTWAKLVLMVPRSKPTPRNTIR